MVIALFVLQVTILFEASQYVHGNDWPYEKSCRDNFVVDIPNG
jgi:hypothetical protein